MLITKLALHLARPAVRAFEEATRDPRVAQKRVLLRYLARNRKTEYGRRYGFASIRTIDDYRARVPLTDYETMRPAIDRIAAGAAKVLTIDPVGFFGITSGTTGKPKLIPVTPYSRRKKSELMQIWASYLTRDHPGVFSGKVLAIISPEVKSHTAAGIPYGPEDGHAYNNLSPLVRHLYSLPYEVFSIEDYDSRYYCILRIAMGQNITTIATLNPTTIVLLCQRIAGVQERILRDIEDGTLDRSLILSSRQRRAIERRLRPNPRRAHELKALLRAKGALLPKDFWPHLELIECWKGGTVKLYLKELPRYFGDIPIRDFGCLSTEARSSVPMSDAGAGGVLAVTTNFYEFIPKEDIGKKEVRILLCDELEKGKEYLIIVTTPGGLYRYNIDDIIRVDGFFNRTPMIEFVQKGKNAVSLTGEKVYESHMNEAVNAAADRTGVLIKFFSSSVEMSDPPRYIFLVEFDDTPSADEKRAFLRAVEEELCKQNSEYKDIREQQLLAMPVLKVVKHGEFDGYRVRKVREGRHDGQFKVPELVGDPAFQKEFVIEEEVQG